MSRPSRGSVWISPPRPSQDVRLRLFCFPHAGGAASVYRPWLDAFAPGIEVCPIQLPGRGSRFGEPPFRCLADLVAASADGLRPYFDRPFAFFGHSMGALVAFDLARELRGRGWAEPVLVGVAGQRAPHLLHPVPALSSLPEAEFIREMRTRYDGIPDAVLAEPDLLALTVPILRADMAALETHRYVHEPPFECSITCLGGEDDAQISLEDLESWRDHTRGPFTLRVFPGGHFFVERERPAVLRALQEDLRPWIGGQSVISTAR